MRKRYNRITWKVVHIVIELSDSIDEIASSKKLDISRDQFFSKIIDKLVDSGYEPLMNIDRMKNRLKSPYSESEYYVFLKIEDEDRLKVVLDVRWSKHGLNEYGNFSSRQRHIHYMETEEIPDIGLEKGLDISSAEPKFIDIADSPSIDFTLIAIDGTYFSTYKDALLEVESKIDQLS